MNQALDKLIQQYPSQWKLLKEGNPEFWGHFTSQLQDKHPDADLEEIEQHIASRLDEKIHTGLLKYTSRGHSILAQLFKTRQTTLKSKVAKLNKEQVLTSEQDTTRNESILDLAELDRLIKQL